jgi:cell division protein FtsI/penicillin-binding protein 2
VALRLTYVQWIMSAQVVRMAEQMHGRTVEVDARRGRIKDRNDSEIATDIITNAITINPRLVASPTATAARLAELLGVDENERNAMRERIEEAAARRRFYCKLRRGVDRKVAAKILAAAKTDKALRGLALENTPARVNPAGGDGLQLIGSVNIDGTGIEAIEKYCDSVLRGRNGERRIRVSGTGAPIPESETRVVEPVDGRDVRLTIDQDIQHFAEVELAKVAKAQSPDAATAIVLDVRNGDVLGMANWPTYQPKEKKVTPAQRRNRAVTDLYEPGSTFKVITAAAALEHDVRTGFHCAGSRTIGRRTVRCAHGSHGSVDLRKMIEVSCNLSAGALAERVGPKGMHDFLDLFGFQKKTGIEFPGEEYATLQSPEKWATMRTVNIGFGQGIVVTPIQLAAAYAAIGNDGVYNPPRLVLDAPGMDLPQRQPRRVMTSSNAAALRSYMEAVVVGSNGTGKAAKIPGYSVAGKTGTAQIATSRGYGRGRLASFVGLVPAGKPRLAILVSVWHPRRGSYGGVVSAPVFREIARQSVSYLGIEPDTPRDLRDGANTGTAAWKAHGGGGGGGHD